jgi:hypothetical protein
VLLMKIFQNAKSAAKKIKMVLVEPFSICEK